MTLGQKLHNAIKDSGITIPEAAKHIGTSEANLYKLFKKDTFEVAYLIKAVALFNKPLSYFIEDIPTTTLSQTGTGNTNQINTGNTITKNTGTATQYFKSTGDCEQALAAAHVQNQQLQSQLHDKERIIQLLELQLKK